MPGRPQRRRRAPERFGKFADEREAEVAEESSEEEAGSKRRVRRRPDPDSEGEEEEEAPVKQRASKQRKRKRRPTPEEEEEEEEEASEEETSEGEEEEEEEEEEEVTPAGRRGGKGKGRGPKRARAASSPAAVPPYVPAPPAEPRSRSDMLSLLFACPALIDALLLHDGLRTISLVARDAGNLAAALGARHAEMAILWQQLAHRCDPSFHAPVSDIEQALKVVKAAVQADPARRERINKSTAQSEYRVTEKDLRDLPFKTRPNPVFWHAAPVKMYQKLDVLAIAHRKHGSAAGLEASRRAAAAKSQKAKATRQDKTEQRRQEMEEALMAAGLRALHKDDYFWDRDVKEFIKRGKGTAAGIAAAHRQEQEAARAKAERSQQLRDRLTELNLSWSDLISTRAAASFVSGTSKRSLEEAVTAAQQEHEETAGKAARRAQLAQLLAAEGLPQNTCLLSYIPGLAAFLNKGEGGAQAAVAAVRKFHDAQQSKEQRSLALTARLEAEGLAEHRYGTAAVAAYISDGKGSEEEAVEAARQAKAAAAARAERRSRMLELLEAEGLGSHVHERSVYRFINDGEGSEQEAVEAARAAAQARAERRARVTALLAAEGIQLADVQEAVAYYILVGISSEQEVVDSARQALADRVQQQQEQRERGQRLQTLRQMLQAENLCYADWQHSRQLAKYVQHGEGEIDALVALVKKWQSAAQVMVAAGAAPAAAAADAMLG